MYIHIYIYIYTYLYVSIQTYILHMIHTYIHKHGCANLEACIHIRYIEKKYIHMKG